MKKETIQPESRALAFRDLILKTPIGEKIPTCMQCGICAGSCPVSHEMDYTPRQLVRMVQLGLKKDVLNSNTIWICTTCFSCSVRCPRGIRPTELMEMLKPIAVAEGIRNKNAKFYQVFSDVAKKVVSIINLASVAAIETLVGAPVDPLRFRANLYAEGWPAWDEFELLGRTLAIGAEARLRVVKRIERCAATNVEPGTGIRDMTIPHSLLRACGHTDCGVYAEVIAGGPIAAGDRIEIFDED